jgi:hypothetical protein
MYHITGARNLVLLRMVAAQIFSNSLLFLAKMAKGDTGLFFVALLKAAWTSVRFLLSYNYVCGWFVGFAVEPLCCWLWFFSVRF